MSAPLVTGAIALYAAAHPEKTPQQIRYDLLTAGARVSLSWKDNPNNENGFLIERKNGNAWQTLATTAPNTTTFVDVTAARRTTDGYRGAPTPTCRRHLDDSPSKENPDPC